MIANSDAFAEESQEATVSDKETEEEQPMDTEVVDSFLCCLVPVLCQLYHQTLLATIRRSSLNLLRRAIHFFHADSLEAVCQRKEGFAEGLVEMLASVLDQDEDEEGQHQALKVRQLLLFNQQLIVKVNMCFFCS